MKNKIRLMISLLFLIFSAGLFAADINEESIGYVRVNRGSGVCTLYLKEGKSGKLIPITNESRSTTSPNFGTIKYNGDVFKTTASRFQLNVDNLDNGFLIERKSSFVSFKEEVTVINKVTESGVQHFFRIKLTVKNLKSKPADIELRYVFDSFSKESKEAILLNHDTVVKESRRVDDFSGIGDVGYVTDFNMKPIWFTPEDDTRNEIDFIVISNWKKLNYTSWYSRRLITGDFFSYPESRADTALAFYFEEVSLDENEAVSYSFLLEGGDLSTVVRNDLMKVTEEEVELGEPLPAEEPETVAEEVVNKVPEIVPEKVINNKRSSSEVTVTEKIIDTLLQEIDEQMSRVDSLSPEELAKLTGKIETLERYKEIYEKSKR